MYRLPQLTPFPPGASDVCWGVQKMFRTRAKYNDTVHRQIQQQAYAFYSSQTHTHTQRERERERAKPRYSATPTWKSVSRNFLLYISMHHCPWRMATLRRTNCGAVSGLDHTHTHTSSSSRRSNPLLLLNSSAATVCRSVCYKFVDWNKRIPLQRISNQKQ